MIDFGGYFDKCELYFGALIKKINWNLLLLAYIGFSI